MRWLKRLFRIKKGKTPFATITTIEGKRHYSAPPGGYGDWKNPTVDLWGKRNTSSGKFEKIKREGKPFKGVKREN